MPAVVDNARLTSEAVVARGSTTPAAAVFAEPLPQVVH